MRQNLAMITTFAYARNAPIAISTVNPRKWVWKLHCSSCSCNIRLLRRTHDCRSKEISRGYKDATVWLWQKAKTTSLNWQRCSFFMTLCRKIVAFLCWSHIILVTRLGPTRCAKRRAVHVKPTEWADFLYDNNKRKIWMWRQTAWIHSEP